MIQISNIDISYNHKYILKGLNLTVEENEKVLVTGISGSGKTSLFKALLGFIPFSNGKIVVQDTVSDRKNIKYIRSLMFYMSQDVDLRNEIIGVLIHDICSANGILDIPPATMNPLLAFLDLLPDVLQKTVNDLSGGERQRIGLLLCFLLDRPIWLLDEPTSALDDLMKKKMAAHILNQEKTVIIISHDEIWKTFHHIRVHRV